jgi:hypothetical protein
MSNNCQIIKKCQTCQIITNNYYISSTATCQMPNWILTAMSKHWVYPWTLYTKGSLHFQIFLLLHSWQIMAYSLTATSWTNFSFTSIAFCRKCQFLPHLLVLPHLWRKYVFKNHDAGANPTTAIYNASAVKIYIATSSLEPILRFLNLQLQRQHCSRLERFLK